MPNKTLRRIYLAGAIEGCSDFGTTWREAVTPSLTEMGFEVVDPTKHELKGLSPEEVAAIRAKEVGSAGGMSEYRALVGGRIVVPDLLEVARCSHLLCKWATNTSCGSAGEVTFAKFLNKEVMLVADMPVEQISSWIIGCSTSIFPSVEACLASLAESLRRVN